MGRRWSLLTCLPQKLHLVFCHRAQLLAWGWGMVGCAQRVCMRWRFFFRLDILCDGRLCVGVDICLQLCMSSVSRMKSILNPLLRRRTSIWAVNLLLRRLLLLPLPLYLISASNCCCGCGCCCCCCNQQFTSAQKIVEGLTNASAEEPAAEGESFGNFYGGFY